MGDERRSRQQPASPMAGAPPKRPLPRWTFGLLNPVMKALLRSPLHHLVSVMAGCQVIHVHFW